MSKTCFDLLQYIRPTAKRVFVLVLTGFFGVTPQDSDEMADNTVLKWNTRWCARARARALPKGRLMNIDKSLLLHSPSLTLRTDSLKAASAFKVGAVLDVLVTEHRGDNRYRLQWNGQELNASSKRSLTVGSRELLQITGRDSQGRWQTDSLPLQEKRVELALRQRLSQQIPLSRLLSSPPSSTQGQPETTRLQQWLAPLSKALLSKADVTSPSGLKEAIQRSGLFLESQLAAGKRPSPRDLKRVLLQLLQTAAATKLATPAPMGNRTAPPLPSPAGTPPAAQAGAVQANAIPQKPDFPPPAAPTRSPAGVSKTPPPPILAPAKLSPLPTERKPLLTSGFRSPDTAQVTQSSRLPSGSALPASTPPRVQHAYQQVANSQDPSLALAARGLGDLDWDSPPQVQRALEGALARLESQQLLSVQAREANSLMWLLELPVRNQESLDLWQCYLRQEKRNANTATEHTESKHWQVTLSVKLDLVGELAIHIRHAEDQTTITYYSKQTSVLDAIDSRGGDFAEHLAKLGVVNTQVSGVFGSVPTEHQPDIHTSELSERA